jgi:hypothetical protein
MLDGTVDAAIVVRCWFGRDGSKSGSQAVPRLARREGLPTLHPRSFPARLPAHLSLSFSLHHTPHTTLGLPQSRWLNSDGPQQIARDVWPSLILSGTQVHRTRTFLAVSSRLPSVASPMPSHISPTATATERTNPPNDL